MPATSSVARAIQRKPKAKADRQTRLQESHVAPARLDMLIGVQVRKLRRMNHIAMRDLSNASKISLPTLSRIENGRRSVSLSMLQKLARGLGVPIHQLVEAESHIAPTSHQPRETVAKGKFASAYQSGRLRLEAHRTLTTSKNEQPEMHRSSGPTTVHVCRGECVYQYGTRSQTLGEGDSLLIGARIRHGLLKALKLPVELIVIATTLRSMLTPPNWASDLCVMVCETV